MAHIIKNRKFNLAEEQIIKHLMEGAGVTRLVAEEEVAGYKREQAMFYHQQGNFELYRHLLQELDEWDDTREEDFKNSTISHTKIFIPGE